jgi:uncharacterized phage protein gp47/JayE
MNSIGIMSPQTPSSNVYSIYKQNAQKYFENVTKNVPSYLQSITHLQEQCVNTCEKAIEATISVQQEFVKKAGINSEISEETKNAYIDTNKQIVQASNVQNQIVKTTIDATVQNIKTFNDNVIAFADLNKNIIQSWMTPFTLAKN